MNKNKKGFTLVELLAVIALLALLMGIAVPNIISTINNGKRSDFLSDTKRMVAKAESLISASKDDRNAVRQGGYKVYRFAELNAKMEFANDPDGGSYDSNTYVKVTLQSNSYKYCICALGTKRRVGSGSSQTCNPTNANDCLDSNLLTGIDVVKDL